ncbi:TIGR04086 family membrane protein [Pseudomonas sp. F(2018)]|uniref:TIGR04086 family membrane protein n=1 Tax=Pseudomonas sp. F(2018) TaxID=2502240 RepID=UPI0010F43B49|nr:TIGR04086 family membrane protein [Pseudomonas sp. F(2018)]
MERNPILLGLAAAAIAYPVVKLVKVTLGSNIADILMEAISNLPWLAGGFVAGYKSKFSPLKNGAITGALYGLIFCLIGIVLVSTQTYGMQEKISQLGIAAIAIIKFSFLFFLASALGCVQKLPRTVL